MVTLDISQASFPVVGSSKPERACQKSGYASLTMALNPYIPGPSGFESIVLICFIRMHFDHHCIDFCPPSISLTKKSAIDNIGAFGQFSNIHLFPKHSNSFYVSKSFPGWQHLLDSDVCSIMSSFSKASARLGIYKGFKANVFVRYWIQGNTNMNIMNTTWETPKTYLNIYHSKDFFF